MNATTLPLFTPVRLSIAAGLGALMTLHALIAVGSPGQQAATPVLEKRAAVVSVADLDISTPRGADAARERLHTMARKLCSELQDSLNVGHQPQFVACVQRTLDAALRSMTATASQAQNGHPTALNSPALGRQPVVHSPESRALKVSLADLDLSTTSGAQMARNRIHEAARHLCSQLADIDNLGHQPQFVACVDDATARTLQQMAGPEVAATDGRRAARHAIP